jgi:endoglucanase
MRQALFMLVLFASTGLFSQTLNVRYNQIGYQIGRPKIINLTSKSPFQGQQYKITDSSGSIIKSGVSSQSVTWEYSKEYVSMVDFTDVNLPGEYTIKVGAVEKKIKIKKLAYEDLAKASLKYYYYNRASMALDVQYAGVYKRPMGHPDTLVYVHASAATTARPVNTKISCPRGWYDAGDYNKYIVNSGISTYTLLSAYEHYPSYYDGYAIGIPEAGGLLPDILDEAKWNLDWMVTMQDPNDGGVYHKCTDLNFNGETMPHNYNAKRYVVAKSTAATLNLAGVFAVAARVYKNFDLSLSNQYQAAAIKAYDWAKLNPTKYYAQPNDVKTGEYGDGNVKDEFDWAAAELFITTKDPRYSNDLNEKAIGEGVAAWPYTAPMATISLLHHENDIANDIDIIAVKQKLISTANSLLSTINTSSMKVAMGNQDGDFVWGSNGQAGNQIIMLIRAYELTKDRTYLDGAFTAFDYLVGRNSTGYSFVTGHGDLTPQKPHHRISQADGIPAPVPGMLVGGPHPGRQDGCAGYPSTQPASCYVDTWCSYSTNEVTINWNAPLAYAANALSYYQNQSIINASSDPTVEINVAIYPNITNGELNISFDQAFDISNTEIEIYHLSGNVVEKFIPQTHQSKVDLGKYSAGIYFVNVKSAAGKTVKKVVKI